MSDDKPFGLVQLLMGETTPHARLPGNPSNAVAPLGEAPLYEGEDRAASPLRVYACQFYQRNEIGTVKSKSWILPS